MQKEKHNKEENHEMLPRHTNKALNRLRYLQCSWLGKNNINESMHVCNSSQSISEVFFLELDNYKAHLKG